ncbi:MAG: flavodoxin domain-containing protein [Candidatus Methanoperedens sp.]|nr:flavodoxin domain-containing protein [Candidatus Methanoperedens sp.]MCE8425467.1 flavodoxin domain-containing protein [Candidatus Methanoperedens sp.]MCE8427928.1 flavodoxin domain-containing protein [Candidatus Methanoperedens sp.]
MEKKLAIIYGTGFGNTGIMARAIEEGAKNAGLDVITKKIDEASSSDVEKADAIAIGLATYKGAGMPTVIKYVESLAKIPLKDKIGTAFGSYGWSGEGPIAVTNMLKGYGMNVIEPSLRIKRIPEEEGIEECKQLGKKIAQMLK